jgi:hypothetical protein
MTTGRLSVAAAAVAAAITLAGHARGATGPMTDYDPDLSTTLLFLGAVMTTMALPLLAFRLGPTARRVALGASFGVVAGFAAWAANQPVNAGLEWPLLIGAGLAVGDAALLLIAPRAASVLAMVAAVVVVLAAPLPARLMARSLISAGGGGSASFSSWITFAGVYAVIVLGLGVLMSSPVHPGRPKGEAQAHLPS